MVEDTEAKRSVSNDLSLHVICVSCFKIKSRPGSEGAMMSTAIPDLEESMVWWAIAMAYVHD